MSKNELQEFVTKEYLGEFTEKVILPGVGKIVDNLHKEMRVEINEVWVETKDVKNRMQQNHNEIISILDKQGKILEKLETENASHVASYKRHDDNIKDVLHRLSGVERKLKIQSLLKKPRSSAY
jgi:hypothetical protein